MAGINASRWLAGREPEPPGWAGRQWDRGYALVEAGFRGAIRWSLRRRLAGFIDTAAAYRTEGIVYTIKDGVVVDNAKAMERVVELVAKRPQVQERMTETVANLLQEKLDPKGVIVVLEAEHSCMSIRGIRKPGSLTITSAVKGLFRKNESSRAEAMALINNKK